LDNAEVVVIGAGPAGSVTADEIAKAGRDVVLIEKANYAGETNVCGGVTPVENADAFEIPAYVRERTLSKWVCYFPNETFSFEIPFISFRRCVFDRFLAEKAKSRGARMITRTIAKNVTVTEDGSVVKLRDDAKNYDYEIRAQLVVFADGPATLGARKFKGSGFQRRPERTFQGLVYEVEMKDKGLETLDLYFDPRIAPWGYGWLFPKGEVINAGICGLMSIWHEQSNQNMRSRLDYFVKEHPKSSDITKNRKIVNLQAAIIPVEPAKKMYADRALFVGDAAGMVEPFTAGGNEFAMRGGKVAAAIAIEALKKGTFGEKFLSKYQKEWEHTEDGKELHRIQTGLEQGLEMRKRGKLDPMIAYLYFYRKLADEAAKKHVYLAQRP